MLKKILLIVLIIIIAFVIVVETRPSEFRYSRSITIAAPAAVIFPHVNDLHNWQTWSPWAKLDPNQKVTFEGPATGNGASMTWDGNSSVGAGRMTVTSSQPSSAVQFRIDFEKPFKGTNIADFTFTPQGDQTLVTWSMSGQSGFIPKAIGMVINCEKMVGDEFDKGLVSLKSLSEAEAKK